MAEIEKIERARVHDGQGVSSSMAYPWSEDIDLDPGFLPCHYFDYIFGSSTGGQVDF